MGVIVKNILFDTLDTSIPLPERLTVNKKIFIIFF